MGDVLFLAHRVPYPPDRGDKIRGFHVLKHLAARRRVHLIAFADDDRDRAHDEVLARYTASRLIVRRSKGKVLAAGQALLSEKPVSLTAFADPRIRSAIEQTLANHDIDTVFVFSGQMAQYLPDGGWRRTVMDFVDVDSAKFAGFAEDARGPIAWMMRREARLLGAFERDVSARVDASLFVSDAEAAIFRDAGGTNARVIENGIDTVRFDPQADFAPVAAATPLIVFTGQMDYRPNVEAVVWFADSILPLLRQSHPDAVFAIVGRNPDARVRALSGLPSVTVTGEVADVRGWLAAASVVVAPLKLARGVQNKVLEAMAMARPVVASTAAAEGIDHGKTIRVSADAGAFADSVGALLNDTTAADALGRQARARVIERYGWDARLAPLDAIMGFGTPARRSAA